MTTDSRDFAALKEDVALSHRLLYRTGLGTTRGHTSARIEGTNTFLIKPWPHIQMHRVRSDDLIIMDFDGNIVGGNVQTKTKVSEWPIHAELYKAYPALGSVLHTHQKWASMMAIAGQTVLPVVSADLATPVAEPAPVYDEDKALIRRVEQGVAVAKLMEGECADGDDGGHRDGVPGGDDVASAGDRQAGCAVARRAACGAGTAHSWGSSGVVGGLLELGGHPAGRAPAQVRRPLVV
jgi:ribulose-5-phosphate 4-epimerase/fuculose-1-phosphate aldolase